MSASIFSRTSTRWILAGAVLLGGAAYAVLRGQGAGNRPGWPGSGDVDVRPALSSLPPRALKCEQDSVEFGVIPLGETRNLKLKIQNPGAKTVRVLQVTSECVCITGKMSSGVLDPGDADSLVLTFRAIPGRTTYKSSVSLITDEVGPCRYDISVLAKIRQEYVLEPETLDFGPVPKGGVSKRELRLRRFDGGPFGIKEILPHCPDIAFSWRSSDPSSKEFVIEAEAKGAHPGLRVDRVRIITDGSPESSVELEITLQVESSFGCKPPTVVSRYGADGRLAPFETVVREKMGGKAVIESVREGRGVALEYDAKPAENGECKVAIKIIGSLSGDQHVGSFLIKIKGEDQPISLPYRVDPERSPKKR
jgi:hypothetical protein